MFDFPMVLAPSVVVPVFMMFNLLAIAAAGRPLDAHQAEAAFDIIMSGDATPAQMGGFLMALRVRGETVDEIIGAARSMRARMLTVDAPARIDAG